MSPTKITTKNPVDVTNWTREKLASHLDERFLELKSAQASDSLLTIEEARRDFKQRLASYNV
ncbi:hypothetical protein IKF40_00305 [Candidatus Saccharibacteria bacterium]|nr:hypothetical protein [Candidatus Saccharibacteria bacterium]